MPETVLETEGGTVATVRTSSVQGPPRLVNEALLYHDEEQFSRVLRSFVAHGNTAGEPVLAALPAHNVEVLLRALGPLSRDVRFEDMGVVGHNPNLVLDLYQEWIDAHDGPVQLIGELIWPGRSYPEVVECLRHEALVNHELAGCAASILCPFDAEGLGEQTLLGAELTHPSLVEGNGTRRPSPCYGDPIELYAGWRWPQPEPTPPVSEIDFCGDLHRLRAAVASDPVVATLGSERRADLVFSVNEVATNALRHGDGICTSRVWRDGHAVVAELTSTSMLDAAVGRRRPAPDAVGGRGLWLVNQLCDLVELRTGQGGTTVRLHVRDTLGEPAVRMTSAGSAV
jgi:hypothetical protein